LAGWPAVVARRAAAAADRRRTLAVLAAVGCTLGLVGVGVLGLAVEAGHDRDAATLYGFTGLYGARIDLEIRVIARFADPVPYACLGLLCIAIALARRLPWRALAVAIVLVGTGVTTQALKHLLAEPRYADRLLGGQIEDASWPSGHSTAAMTLALCAVVVVPPGWRAATALLGGGCALGLAYATLALTWHYPTEVFGGFLVAGAWVSTALAVLTRVEVGDPDPAPPPRFGWLVGLGAAGALVGAAVVGLASERVPLEAGDRVAVVIVALALAALALALVAVTVVAASEPRASGIAPRSPPPSRAALVR
jgi:membrane-associated phospholipid phosphatase